MKIHSYPNTLICYCALTLLFLSACSPPIRLPFRDYNGGIERLETVKKVLENRGFKVANRYNVLQTDTLLTHRLGIYDVSTYFTIIPMKTQIRLQIHTLRKYTLSGRLTELPYIERRIYAQLIRPIEAELKQKGIQYDANF